MKKYLYSTKIVLLLSTLTLVGWTSTFIPAHQQDHQPSVTEPIYDLLETTLTKQNEPEMDASADIIDPQSLEELEIDKVAGVLDCTHTRLGSLTFKHALKHPKNNRAYLTKLQSAIKSLHANQQLADHLTILLKTIKELEPMLIVLLLSKDSIYDTETQQIAPIPPLTHINKIIETLFGKEAPTIPVDRMRAIKNPYLLNLAFFGLASLDLAAISLSGIWFYHTWNETLSKYAFLAPAGILSIVWASAKDFLQRRKATHLVKDHLKALFTYVEQLRTMNTLLKENAYLLELFPELTLITKFVEKPETFSSDVQKISGYKPSGAASWLPSSTWRTYNSVKTEQKNMLSIFKTMGMLDFVLSLATLHTKFQNSRVHFCFATYEQPGSRCLRAQDAWHPLLSAKTVVSNNLTMGSDGSGLKMVLTGPNKGKSTTLKLTALMALLAQTITLVPARTANLPIFDYIGVNTVTTIPDGMAESQAEINRMKIILDRVAQLEPEQLSLTVFDRLLRMEDLKPHNYAITHGLAKYGSNISIIATNNPQLKKLEQDKALHGTFVNFKITSKFKLERGTSSENHDLPWPDDFLPEGMLMAMPQA